MGTVSVYPRLVLKRKSEGWVTRAARYASALQEVFTEAGLTVPLASLKV